MRRMFSLKQLQEIADARVTSLVEGGQLDNAKPIYCHPITITHTEDAVQEATLTCLIFNNSPTPFTKNTFADWIDALYEQVGATIRILISGGYVSNSKLSIGAYMGKSASNPYFITGNFIDGSGESLLRFASKNDFTTYISSFNDGVNKIN